HEQERQTEDDAIGHVATFPCAITTPLLGRIDGDQDRGGPCDVEAIADLDLLERLFVLDARAVLPAVWSTERDRRHLRIDVGDRRRNGALERRRAAGLRAGGWRDG